jgi:hypothetical protein
MTTASEKLKLEMVETLKSIDNDSLIKNLYLAFQEEINKHLINFQKSPEFTRLLEEGLLQIEKGEVGSWAEFDIAVENGMNDGLRIRALDGKPKD